MRDRLHRSQTSAANYRKACDGFEPRKGDLLIGHVKNIRATRASFQGQLSERIQNPSARRICRNLRSFGESCGSERWGGGGLGGIAPGQSLRLTRCRKECAVVDPYAERQVAGKTLRDLLKGEAEAREVEESSVKGED